MIIHLFFELHKTRLRSDLAVLVSRLLSAKMYQNYQNSCLKKFSRSKIDSMDNYCVNWRIRRKYLWSWVGRKRLNKRKKIIINKACWELMINYAAIFSSCLAFVVISSTQFISKMMFNMPVLGVVCEPKPSGVKKFEFFSNNNVTFP